MTSSTGLVASVLADYARGICGPAKDRDFTLGASDIGQCGRKVFFAKHNSERDPGYVDTWGATLRKIIEQAYWVPALRARFGDNLKFVGNRQRQFKRGFISATPDALLTNAPRDILAPLGTPDIGSDCLLLECKSVDPRVKLDSPKPEHKYQAIVQLGVVRETTEFQPCYVVLAYIDASFWDTVTEFVVAFDPGIYANAKARAVKVLTANSASELAPEGWIAGGKECEHCPFTKDCGIERQDIELVRISQEVTATRARPITEQILVPCSKAHFWLTNKQNRNDVLDPFLIVRGYDSEGWFWHINP